MAEAINKNVFNPVAKFIDVNGLDYFWSKAKTYIDEADDAIKGRLSTAEGKISTAEGKISTLETTVGNSTSGLVKDVAALRADVDALGGVEGGIQGMINASIAALDLPNTYDAKGAADQALKDAKAYADGLASNYDVSGAADQALKDAKAYTDAREVVINKKIEDDVKVVADDLKEHVENGTIHITAQERTDWNDAKSKIDTFLKDADMTEKAVDTLAELQAYMTSDGAAAAELVNRVGALEAADTKIREDFAAADATTLASAKSYADGLKAEINGVIEENERITAEALNDLRSDVDALEASKNDYVAADVQVLADAKTYADEKDAAALSTAKTYADGVAAQALTDAKAHVQSVIANYYTKEEIDGKVTTLTNKFDDYYTKTTTDELLAVKANKSDVYTRTEVDNKDAQVLADAKSYASTYTNELFASMDIAQNADIDGIF